MMKSHPKTLTHVVPIIQRPKERKCVEATPRTCQAGSSKIQDTCKTSNRTEVDGSKTSAEEGEVVGEVIHTPRRAGKFSLVDVTIEEPVVPSRKRAKSPSDSTSSTESGAKKRKQARVRRSGCRGKKVLNHIMEHGTELTFLEAQAIGPVTSQQYQVELKGFTDYLQARGIQINLDNATELDGHLVDYLNQMYLEGLQSYKADRLLASFMHRRPEFGKNGSMRLARTWRAIKGYRKLTPGKSREAFLWRCGQPMQWR